MAVPANTNSDNGENLQDARSAREKAIDDWLPITSSRNAKWWYSAFHNVTAMVGAGVLSLPYAMSELGWYVSCLADVAITVTYMPISLLTHLVYYCCMYHKGFLISQFVNCLQGSWHCGADRVMDHHTLHAVADG
jgi:hypothetical protein